MPPVYTRKFTLPYSKKHRCGTKVSECSARFLCQCKADFNLSSIMYVDTITILNFLLYFLSVQRVMQCLAQQASEKIDRTRAHAGEIFLRLLYMDRSVVQTDNKRPDELIAHQMIMVCFGHFGLYSHKSLHLFNLQFLVVIFQPFCSSYTTLQRAS